MYVVFVDRQEKVFGAIFCADGKTARKVGEHGVTSESRRVLDGALQ